MEFGEDDLHPERGRGPASCESAASLLPVSCAPEVDLRTPAEGKLESPCPIPSPPAQQGQFVAGLPTGSAQLCHLCSVGLVPVDARDPAASAHLKWRMLPALSSWVASTDP